MSKVHLEFSSVRTVQMFNQFFTYFPLKIIGTNYPLTVHGSISLPDNYFLFNEQQRDACINLSKHPHIVLGPCGMCIPVCMCINLLVSSATFNLVQSTFTKLNHRFVQSRSKPCIDHQRISRYSSIVE